MALAMVQSRCRGPISSPDEVCYEWIKAVVLRTNIRPTCGDWFLVRVEYEADNTPDVVYAIVELTRARAAAFASKLPDTRKLMWVTCQPVQCIILSMEEEKQLIAWEAEELASRGY